MNSNIKVKVSLYLTPSNVTTVYLCLMSSLFLLVFGTGGYTDIFEIKTEEKIIVQGTIDLFFEDADGELVILDYKTDKVSPHGKEAIADRYRIQLECYANALGKILGKKVKEKLIYLFDTDEVVSL